MKQFLTYLTIALISACTIGVLFWYVILGFLFSFVPAGFAYAWLIKLALILIVGWAGGIGLPIIAFVVIMMVWANEDNGRYRL